MDVIKRKIVSLRDQVEELESEYGKVNEEVEEEKSAREKVSVYKSSCSEFYHFCLNFIAFDRFYNPFLKI